MLVLYRHRKRHERRPDDQGGVSERGRSMLRFQKGSAQELSRKRANADSDAASLSNAQTDTAINNRSASLSETNSDAKEAISAN